MGISLGVEARVYLNTASGETPYVTPTWTEWASIKDASLNLDLTETDSTTRGDGGFRTSEPTLRALELTGNSLKNKDDAVFIAIETAARTRAPIDLLVMDGARTSVDADGWRFVGKVMSWDEGQPLEDLNTIDFSIKPCRNANPPVAVSGPQPPA